MTGTPAPASRTQLRRLPGRVLRVDAAARPEIVDVVSDLADRAFDLTLTPGGRAPDVVLVDDDRGAPAARGIDPRPADRAGRSEAYGIRPTGDRLVIAAGSAEGHFRGLVALLRACGDGLPALAVAEHPHHAWRGLSLDVVRRRFTVDELHRVIDLLAVHDLNVLHLHLTDTQGWTFAVPGHAGLGDTYTGDDLTALERYARERFVTIVPELDVPGHVPAGLEAHVPVAVGAHPMLRWLDAASDGVRPLLADAFGELAARFSSPFLHLGGDEAFGAPDDVYAHTVRAAADIVRELGRRPIGWQEAIRAGALEPDGIVQQWIAERDRFDAAAVRARLSVEYHPLVDVAAACFAQAGDDPARIAAAGLPVIASMSDPLYLDRRPADASRDPGQRELWERLGNPAYEPLPTASVLDHALPAGAAGIEAALWCETVRDIDDVAALLLPRLALVAARAWGAAPDAARAGVASATHAWKRLGFGGFHRSSDIFED